MGSSSSRLILLRRTTTSRWLSTATATVNKDREESLYSKLLALGEADANVADTLNQWVKDGKDLKRYNAISCINQLRKFGKYNHAIQVTLSLSLSLCMYLCLFSRFIFAVILILFIRFYCSLSTWKLFLAIIKLCKNEESQINRT